MSTDLHAKVTLVNVEHQLVRSVVDIMVQRLDGKGIIARLHGVDFSRGPVVISVPGAESGPYQFIIGADGYHDNAVFADGRQPLEINLTLIRQHEDWRATFTPWNDLPPAFDDLRSILQRSPRSLLVETGDVVHLTENGYDALVSESAAAAKAAMLNICYELSVTYEPVDGTRSFLSFVRSIEALGGNRLLAVVDPRLEDILAAIASDPDRFSDWNSLGVDMPRFYVPPHWRMRIGGTRHLRLATMDNSLDVTLDTIRDADVALGTFAIVQSSVPVGHVLPAQTFRRIPHDAHAFDVHEWLMWAASARPPILGIGWYRGSESG